MSTARCARLRCACIWRDVWEMSTLDCTKRRFSRSMRDWLTGWCSLCGFSMWYGTLQIYESAFRL